MVSDKIDDMKKVVMVIEDETLLLQAIDSKLMQNGFDTVSCGSAKQAFDYLANLPNLPDAIWLDYYLKDMNGIEFMNALKADPRWAKIPVVVVSNSATDDKVKHMLALGAKKYVLKADYRLDEIVEMVKTLIEDTHA